MKIRLLTLAIITLNLSVPVLSQTKRVIITADISGFKEKIPVSSDSIWEGADTLVSALINNKMSSRNIMGAEYLIFANPGDTINPNDDSVHESQLKIWRSKAAIAGHLYTWSFETDKPRTITNESLLGGTYLSLPGDSVHISYDAKGEYWFSGRGAEKFQLLYKINKEIAKIPYPFPPTRSRKAKNLTEFFLLNNFLNEQAQRMLPILEANKLKVTQFEYDWIKGHILTPIEFSRLSFFYYVVLRSRIGKRTNNKVNLANAWDSAMYEPLACWLRSSEVQNMPGIGNINYIEYFTLVELLRKFNYPLFDELFETNVKKYIYQQLKLHYTGLFRERILCSFLQEEIIQELTPPYNWFARSIMNDYYTTPGFPAYKNWMKKREKRKEEKYAGISVVNMAPPFSLVDLYGNKYTTANTTNKFIVANFWYSGCEPCKETARQLNKARSLLANDTSNIIFLNISIDIDKKQWKKSVAQSIYVPEGGIQLYTNGLGKLHEIVKDFNVEQFPTVRFINHMGEVVLDESKPFANTFSSKDLFTIVGNQLLMLKDGPYVFFKNGKKMAYGINASNIQDLSTLKQFTSVTDQSDNPFIFSLQDRLDIPPAVYPNPSKMVVLSDIEGNFAAFRKLLQGNGVIDKNFNWSYGNGHLVFAGDMFDRGEQVTECLWLIYSLEEKAREQGGFVHFILGNHEIMNLHGDDRYVKGKYKNNYKLLGKALAEVYGEDSELGRWLRTKNIIEKIGDNLICHGGISSELNQSTLSIEEINRLARPSYGEPKKDYGNDCVNMIMSSVGPFWYRGYYVNNLAENTVDSTLQKFDVNHIITGHTIIADTVSAHYNGKVINTDTRHSLGKSEALLIEEHNYFRVSPTGHKTLLFRKNNGRLIGKEPIAISGYPFRK